MGVTRGPSYLMGGDTALVAPSDVGTAELVSIGSTSVTASASGAVGAVAAMQGVLSLPLLLVIISDHLHSFLLLTPSKLTILMNQAMLHLT